MPRRDRAWALLPSCWTWLRRKGHRPGLCNCSLFPNKSSVHPKKFRLVTLGQAGQLILADAKTNKQIKFWKCPTGSFQHFQKETLNFGRLDSWGNLVAFTTQRRKRWLRVTPSQPILIFWCLQDLSGWVINYFLITFYKLKWSFS